jgi:hypothetical protein
MRQTISWAGPLLLLLSHAHRAGSKAPAEQGTLIFMAAGDKALYDSVAEDLDAMGKVQSVGGKE